MDGRSDEIRVLHVDDDPEFVDMAAAFLEREDERIEVETATSAADGEQRVATGEFDCVVSDYDMPGRTGIEFLERVREEFADLPFIVFTGKGSEAVASEAISAGATDYLQKRGGTEQFELLANRIANAVSRYRAERSERRLVELAENTDRVLYVFTADLSEVLFVNYAYEEMWGRSADHLREDPIGILEGVHPDDRDRFRSVLDRAAGGESAEIECRVNPEREYETWIRARCEPIVEDGEVARLAVSATDVTHEKRRERELLRYERRFEAMFNDPHILVGLIDTDGTVLHVNETAIGYIESDPQDVTGELFWETPWWTQDFRPDLREKVERAAEGEYVEYDADLDGPDGGTYTVSGTIRPVTDGRGEVLSLVVSARDVTDSRERQRELERQNQRLEEFAEVLTHDLRNPLNIAAGYLDVIRQSPDEEAIRNCERALERIESLVDEVQTSVLQDRTEPEERPVDLETAAREAWSTADTRGATLEVDGDLRLRADPDQFRRLLENLFRNAAEHGRPDDAGEDELTVRVVALEDGFAVDDDGVGLPPEITDDVFERGFTTTHEGTGFGLSIVRNIAESHGWDVAVGESESGGARVRFSQVLRSAESVIEMEAGGNDIWNEADQGHFYYETVSGDFDVRVMVPLVENTHAWAKGGLMVRSSIDPAAAHAMVRRRPNGASTLQWRPAEGEEARSLTSNDGRPLKAEEVGEPQHDWLRLVREGDTLRAYTSETGEEGDWFPLAELPASELRLPDEVMLGIAGTSHNHAEATTIRFKHLDGLDPATSEDVGDPIRGGDVRTLHPTMVTVEDPVDVTSTGMTLRGAVEAPEPLAELDVRFEYREATAPEWTAVPARATGSAGSTDEIRAEIEALVPRRYYEYRVVADYGETTLESNATGLVATPSESDGATERGPRSGAPADPDDGFADLAPWLDDDTPIVTVSEPTRDQLETALSVDGPRVVAFETSGTIDLGERDVTVTNDECWVAGQTAPSPGITLVRGRLMIAADDCVIQHVRSRPGDAGLSVEDGFIKEGIQTDDETENVIVDHCTSTWGVKENQSIGNHTGGTTFSNCLIAEGLYDSIHPKNERAFGTLIGDHADRVALLGNLWAHNVDWNPRLKDDTHVAAANNVHCHYDGGIEVEGGARLTLEADVFARSTGERPDVFGPGSVYVDEVACSRDDEQFLLDDDLRVLSERPYWPAGFERLPVGSVFERVLDHAGARPADRTEHDRRVIEQVRSGTGETIDSQDEVGGYPRLDENYEPLDEPARNLRAWLRERARAVESDT